MPQFVEPIRAGRKRHTIRARRTIPVKVGDQLYLYTGLRHKGAQRILPGAVTCTRTQTIRIQSEVTNLVVEIDGQVLDVDECARLAVADGFPDFTAFHAFWERVHGDKAGQVHFTGQIIHWKNPKATN